MTAHRRTLPHIPTDRTLAALGVLLAVSALRCGRADGGVNVWTTRGPEGGSVVALAAASGSPTRLLALAAAGTVTPSGGLWASNDAGASWQRCAFGGDPGWVGGVVFDPSNPTVAYATSQNGVLRSQDGGRHWISVSAVLAETIVIAPSNPMRLYAANQGTIFRSDDGAISWSSATSDLPTGVWVDDLAVQPDSEEEVYAGTNSGVFKSTDGGATWVTSSAGLPNGGSVSVSVTFDFHRPANLLAVVHGTTREPDGLYRSTNGGASWVAVFRNPGLAGLSAIALGPSNPSLTYLAAGRTVFKSSDDGGSWSTIAVELPINVGIGALALDPNDAETVYAGITGGVGVLKSSDGGTTWPPSGRGLTNTSVATLALNPAPGNTLYALGDTIGLFSSTDDGENWTSLGDIGCFFPSAIVVDPSSPSTLYAGCRGNGAFKSYDGGRSWARINQGFSFGEIYALAIDPSNPLTLYAGSRRFDDMGTVLGNPVYKTSDGGGAWEVMSSGLSNTSITINALVVDPRDRATVFAGGQGLWRSSNGGHDWALFSSLTLFPSILAIVVDPRDPSTIFCTVNSRPMTVGGFVYRTTDQGATWTGSSPPSGAGTMVLDPVKPSAAYVGGYGGVSMSLDRGTTWALINGGMTDVRVTALAIDRTGTRLHAATDGGGVFDLEVSMTTPEISVSPDAVTIAAGASTVMTATIDPPQLTDTQLAASSSNPEIAFVSDVVTLPAGDASVAFTATGAIARGTTVISVRLPDVLGGASAAATITVVTRAVRGPRKRLHGTAP
jgi:photosystem II stability/assembly factor-like uncharacterized protein